MSETTEYVHLAPRDASSYQQYFVKGRSLRAETLYRATVGPEPMSPDDVAQDYDVPVEAVLEAIEYCVRNAALLETERDEDWSQSRSRASAVTPPLSSVAPVDP
jgi:uncharacterized protein (DUF433 family)